MANCEERKNRDKIFIAKMCILPNRNPRNCVNITNQNWVPTLRVAIFAGRNAADFQVFYQITELSFREIFGYPRN